MQRAVERAGAGDDDPLRIRVGVSHGDVEQIDDDYYGPAVVEAARLCAAADAAEILVADLLRALVAGRTDHLLTPRGAYELKGLPTPMEVHAVDWRVARPSTPYPAGLSRPTLSEFVPREEPWLQILERWRAAEAGSGGVVMIGGEPGIGKTRLAAESARALHGDGARVLFGRCSEEQLRPYQPFVEALTEHVATVPPDELLAEIEIGSVQLARIIPAVGRALVGPTGALPAPTAAPATERILLFEAIGAWLDAIAERHATVLLVLDDLHWADPSTLQLVTYLALRPEQHRLLVVGTYRETEIARTHPLGSMLADLRRDRVLDRCSIQGLDVAGLRAVIESVTGHRPPDEFVHLLAAETEGNPFFAEEVLVHLREAGALDAGSPDWVSGSIGDLGIPEGVRDVVGRRLSRLGPATNDLLHVAAVIGREFAFDVVAAAGGASPGEVVDALDDAVVAGLVEEASGGVGRYQFAHALVRQTLLDEVTTTRRMALHQRVADAVASSPRAAHDRDSVIAHHLHEASPLVGVDRAIGAARTAAGRAVERLAYDEAIGWYERALQVLDALAPDDGSTGARLALRISELANVRHDADRAASAARLAASYARRSEDVAALGESAWCLQYAIWNPAFANPEVVGLCEEVLDALDPSAPADLRAHVMGTLAHELGAEDTDRADALASSAIELARRSGDARTIAPAAYVYGQALIRRRQLPDAIATTRDALAAAQTLHDVAFEFTDRLTLCELLLRTGDATGYRSERDDYHRWARSTRSRLALAYSSTLRSGDLLFAGRLDDCAGEIDQLEATQLDPTLLVTLARGLQRISIAHERGQFELAADSVGVALDVFPSGSWRLALASILHHRGSVDEAVDAYEEAWLAGPDDIVHRLPQLGPVLAAEACATFEDRGRVDAVRALLEPHAGLLLVVGTVMECRGATELYLGMLSRLDECHDDAVALLEHAADVHQRFGTGRWIARTDRELARVLLERRRPGDVDRARTLLVRARALASDLGLAWTVHQIEETASSLDR
jgi:tetratricopeptide (TPR) repeat protein